MALIGKKKNVPEDGQMELVEHLAELRTRIFRSLLYLIVGMVVTYNFFKPLYRIINDPLTRALVQHGVSGTIKFDSVQDAFFLKLQVSFIAGLAIALPLLVMELWGFIKPALTPKEREPVKFLAPFSVLLFLAGVGTGYAVLPLAYDWMVGYLGDVPDAQLLQDAAKYLLLSVKIILAFGIAFQLPVVLLFLARVGILTSKLMVAYWRHAVVVLAALAAIFVPSNDPITMVMMAVPMAGLYLLSISLVKAFEPREDGTQNKPLLTMILVSLAPAIMLGAVSYWIVRQRAVPIQKPGMILPTATSAPTVSPDIEKRLAALEEKVTQQAEELAALKAALEQKTATPSPVPQATPAPTAEPSATPNPVTPNMPQDGR
ncbi:twin-arginine translocase subunit TatC [Armatimonas rosea]|uniref:Sec-independent protein translocase protein TatC n=1 Tax=Armatimonas rosea TaxID=685828 RepID=A0A7W9W561_ARMRO|nr:twin-arginine translocase subunit TatC [Armatimonas rosea]MBB6049233.1 Tat protein translocase TatC [Armatimonas rosea]